MPRFWSFVNWEQNKFSSKYPWYLARNYFSLLLEDFLARLQESGIYSFWGKRHDLNKKVEESRLSGLNFSSVIIQWQGATKWNSVGENDTEDVPISVDSVKVIFLVYGVMLMTACSVAALEVTYILYF
jgi:hypothetical protein